MDIDFAADSPDNAAPNTEQRLEVLQVARDFIYSVKELQRMEVEVKKQKEKVRELAEARVPTVFQSAGISRYELRMPEGIETIDLKQIVAANIPKYAKDEALAWLRANGHADIIKSSITVYFGKGEDAHKSAFMSLVNQYGLEYEEKSGVHGATLKSWAKKLITSGKIIGTEAIRVFVGTRAELRGAEPEKEEDNE